MQSESYQESTTDSALMQAYCNGDAQAFNALYERYRSSLYQYILNSCKGPDIADELFQEVWSSVIKSRHRYQEPVAFNAWLFRIARHRLVDHYRSSASQRGQKAKNEKSSSHRSMSSAAVATRGEHYSFNEETDSPLSEATAIHIQKPLEPDEIQALGKRSEALQQALLTLPEKQRESVLLHHIAGMSIAEIAQFVGENNETVKSRLRYAFLKLRKQLRTAIQ